MLALRAGTAAGVYVAMESAVEETRGRTDWVINLTTCSNVLN